MKNDIDSLLESMFRNGKMNFKGEEESAEQVAAQARAQMEELDRRLKRDGVESSSAGNGGDPSRLEAAFAAARREAGEKVLGQDAFLSALTIALKRPFVAGTAAGEPLGRCLVLGKEGTGRHSALEALTASLGRQGVLKSPKLAFIDLGCYGEPGSEKLFFQDLYAALKGGASGLVFENFEKCHPSVLPLVSDLFQKGEVPLPGRYAEQKGMLVDIGAALVPGAVSSLSGGGRYLFLLTEKSESQLAGAFGMPFLSSLDDICETQAFSPEILKAVAERELKELCAKAKQKLDFDLTYDQAAAEALAGAFDPQRGAASLEEAAGRLYRAVSEEKLRRGILRLSGAVSGENGELLVRYQAAGESVILRVGGAVGDAARESAVQEVKQELSQIVGLGAVKEYILSLEDNFKIQRMRREKGLKAESPSMHMIFTGNPGTGKTTMARLVSRYLKAIGVLSGGQLIEVTRADLVGRYVGHTAPLTAKAIQSALGGVLFVDEAYSLYRGKDDSFGLEAIDALVKGMEDHRDQLVVILAGYSYEMEEFLTANSGLRSRFPNIIQFQDYTAEELLEITRSIVKGKGYRLDPGCEAPLLAYYDRMQREGDPRTNGNGRMARNKVEEAILACSRRNVKAPEEQRDLELLLPEDFDFSEENR